MNFKQHLNERDTPGELPEMLFPIVVSTDNTATSGFDSSAWADFKFSSFSLASAIASGEGGLIDTLCLSKIKSNQAFKTLMIQPV
jgi:hypothetical protein